MLNTTLNRWGWHPKSVESAVSMAQVEDWARQRRIALNKHEDYRTAVVIIPTGKKRG